MALTSVLIRPGINKSDTPSGAEGQWIDSDFVRFRYGQPEKIGGGIAVAFIATIWGVGAANLWGIPVSKRLKRIAMLEGYGREMVIIGVEGILNGLNPKIIESKLNVYTNPQDEE